MLTRPPEIDDINFLAPSLNITTHWNRKVTTHVCVSMQILRVSGKRRCGFCNKINGTGSQCVVKELPVVP